MSRDEWIFLLVCIVNTVIALLYFLYGTVIHVSVRKSSLEEGQEMLYDDRKTFLFRTIVMILCPVAGPMFFLCGFLLYGTVYRQKVDLEDVIFNKERVKMHLKADEERERDMVPLEEALKISDKKNLRMLMLNIIRGDMEESLEVISMALDSEDSETSHYAASVLHDELNAFRSNVQKYYELIQPSEDSEDVEAADKTGYEELLIDYMVKVLQQRIFTELEQTRYVNILEQVGEILYEKDPSKLTPGRYEGICLLLLENQEYDRTEKWCQRLWKQYPEELASYTCRLKLYFTREDREAFLQTLQELRESDIIIDNEMLELIRIFS